MKIETWYEPKKAQNRHAIQSKPHARFLDRTKSEGYKYPTHFKLERSTEREGKENKRKERIGPGAKKQPEPISRQDQAEVSREKGEERFLERRKTFFVNFLKM